MVSTSPAGPEVLVLSYTAEWDNFEAHLEQAWSEQHIIPALPATLSEPRGTDTLLWSSST